MKIKGRGWILATVAFASVLLFGGRVVLAGEAKGLPPDHAEDVRQAVAAAEAWLALIDSGEYGKSWDEAAPYLKGAAKKEQFQTSLDGVRKPLGKLIARTAKGKQYSMSLPGAPDGEYVVIQFETSFENKKQAVETVTPMKDGDGKWRVSGYFIK